VFVTVFVFVFVFVLVLVLVQAEHVLDIGHLHVDPGIVTPAQVDHQGVNSLEGVDLVPAPDGDLVAVLDDANDVIGGVAGDGQVRTGDGPVAAAVLAFELVHLPGKPAGAQDWGGLASRTSC